MKEIPNGQLLFKLGEAAEKLGLETHILRYWEKEFSTYIKPIKIGLRKRLYSKQDLETFGAIRRLLHEQRFTVEGAKKQLAGVSGQQRRKLFDDVQEQGRPAKGPAGPPKGQPAPSKPQPLPPKPQGDAAPAGEDPRLRELVGDIRSGLMGLRELLLGPPGTIQAPDAEDGGGAKEGEGPG
ncbi:MAG: MerR family transcriptional regulator [Deltaproteobacteria bacterium]|jgi:DNA-binding transcriptional MerR regulator|nr:MerR family transcriptional regulator [Deltaproteobacteria bacterium]